MHRVTVVVMVNQVLWVQQALRVMQVIQVNRAHQAAQAKWVTLVHQALHFQAKKEKRVFLVQSVFLVHKVYQVPKENQVDQHLKHYNRSLAHKVKKVIEDYQGLQAPPDFKDQTAYQVYQAHPD